MVAPLIVWRHPQPVGAQGRCVGRVDLPVDRRKAKRLAHRIRQRVRREAWARVVVTSPLARSAEVGRWLARWGFEHRIDARLCELDFGRWDGRCWADVGAAELGAWTNAFADHAPGGGESVRELMARCRSFLEELGDAPLCAVGHAGWINAARWVAAGELHPLSAAEWPAAVPYAAAVSFFSNSGGAESQ
ncbi:histidine phosphatase family protein [Piscinibacter gummiphilus]|uniref:Histidine phosphatase family protein n=1 Tax=Piscinibacter gummiphilus TaxID=946333 RepID=A0ABZ0D568_9BURK|nr:histidine phosphatase family protein [Piscinibacter gummiphilus]WOB10392.1 histidine phosphatase family protein [Piscinibacter gummiphilus]